MFSQILGNGSDNNIEEYLQNSGKQLKCLSKIRIKIEININDKRIAVQTEELKPVKYLKYGHCFDAE